MTTYAEAIDFMYGEVKNVVDNQASPILGYLPSIEYDEPAEADHASLELAFMRVSVRNVVDQQLTLSAEDSNGGHVYETIGFLAVQVFIPKTDTEGTQHGRNLCSLVQKRFREAGANNDVWFKNVTINELSPDERWRRFNVISEYNFTETA